MEFGDIAGRLGVKTRRAAGLGWPPAIEVGSEVLTPDARRQFRREIKMLDKAMTDWTAEAADAIGVKRERGCGL